MASQLSVFDELAQFELVEFEEPIKDIKINPKNTVKRVKLPVHIEDLSKTDAETVVNTINSRNKEAGNGEETILVNSFGEPFILLAFLKCIWTRFQVFVPLLEEVCVLFTLNK